MTRDCIVYVRISQDRAGAGLGVQRQTEDCRALAESLSWNVVDVITDNDVSASTGRRRPGYERLLEALRAGRATGVIAWHTDRLHRSPLELEEYVDVCDKRGITTSTVQAGPLDLSTPSGRAVARTLGAWSRFEVEHKAERTRRAQQQAAAEGKWLGGTRPFGWQFDNGTPVLVPAEGEAIHRGTRDILAGRSLWSVAKSWNDAGLTSSMGNQFGVTTTRAVLLRARNAGLATWHGDVVGQSTFPAAVTEDEWRAVVAILRAPNRPGAGGDTRAKHLMAGIARCPCGRPVRSSIAGGRRPEYTRVVYRCRQSGPGHVGKTAQHVDELVTAVVLARLSQPDALEMLTPAEATEDLAGEATLLRDRLDELAGAYARGTVTLAQLETGTAALKSTLEATESRMRAQPGRGAVAELLLEGDDVAAAWDAADVETRRAVVRSLVDVTLLRTAKSSRRAFDPETVKIEWRTS